MFEPSCDIFPSLVKFVLLRFPNYFWCSSDILLLYYSLLYYMISLTLNICLLCHLNHLHSLLVLRLAPLRERSATVQSPKHVSHLSKAWVLISCQLFVPRKLSNILKASLPEWLEHDIFNAHREMLLTARVLPPLPKEESKPALEVIILIELCHESHYFTSFHNSLINLGIRASSLFHEDFLLSLKLCIVSLLHNGHVAHLILHLCDGLSLIIDIGDRLPVSKDC